VLGLLALFVALGGTALAATGQLVNIADPTNAANVAKVDTTGALKTTGTVTNIPVPSKIFLVRAYVGDNGSYQSVFPATTATIAINRIVVSDDFGQYQRPRQVILDLLTVNAGQACSLSSTGVAIQPIGTYAIQSSGSAIDNPSPPLVFKPTGTKPWCLIAADTPASNPGNTYASVSVSGWVVSGTAPAGTTAASATSAKALDAMGPHRP
jgi:hypothetical protein